ERFFADRQRGEPVVGIPDGLPEHAHVALQLVGDRQASGVVERVVDAHAGRQPLERPVQARSGLFQVTMDVDRREVGVDEECHTKVSSLMFSRRGSVPNATPPVLEYLYRVIPGTT